MGKAGGKPKRAKYINKTFRNEKKKKCRNGASRKHHIKAKMRISFLQTLLNFNELCRAEFPLYFFAKCSFVENVLLFIAYIVHRASCLEAIWICLRTNNCHLYIYLFKKALITVLATCTFTKNAFVSPIQNSHPF
jgi:hypothetical protein